MNNYTRKKVGGDGTVSYYNDKGKLHRLDGPAVEYAVGDKYWYNNGEFHRLDGPALEYANGYKAWYNNGKRLTEEEVRLLQNELKIKKALGLIDG